MVFHREVFVIADVRGRVLGRLVQGLCTVTLVALCSNPLFAQGTLALSSGTAAANGNATLNLTLTSPAGSEPAGIQWTLTYSPTDIVSISAIAGTSGTAAGKSITCAASSGSYMCLLVGLNTNVMQNGVAAVVSVTISPGVASTTINVTNTLGATAAAAALPINGVGGIVTSGAPPVTGIRAMSCLPASLSTGGSATCTVSLNTAAPAGGATVSLSSYAAALTVPNSVTVGAGNTTVTFTATAGTISTDQLATLMATLNGRTQTATISLVTPATLSGLAAPGAIDDDGAPRTRRGPAWAEPQFCAGYADGAGDVHGCVFVEPPNIENPDIGVGRNQRSYFVSGPRGRVPAGLNQFAKGLGIGIHILKQFVARHLPGLQPSVEVTNVGVPQRHQLIRG